jgi:beta-mannosidase
LANFTGGGQVTGAKEHRVEIVRRPLDTGWTVRVAAGPAPPEVAAAVVQAAVPGVVHLDLLSAGLIPDPYLDVNEALLAWIGLVD